MRQNVDSMVQTLESEGVFTYGQPFYQAVVVGTREPEEREPGNEVGSPEVQHHLVFTTILHLSERARIHPLGRFCVYFR